MKVVNRRVHTPGPHDVYVGRPSPLGNPYPITATRDRQTMIADYRVWLRQKVAARDPGVMRALRALNEDSVLVCWCAPLPCHAHVITEAWHAMKRAGWL